MITADHRAIRLAENVEVGIYHAAEFEARAHRMSSARWTGAVLPSLLHSAAEATGLRLTAAASRAKSRLPDYNSSRAGSAEIATEILFDSGFCKPNEKNLSRRAVHEHFKGLRDRREPVRLGLPLFSRKPISPLKNRGPNPDLAEIASILRCHTVAKMLSHVHDSAAQFVIYADGHKYRRACGTPATVVAAYQADLLYWCHQLGLTDLVQIVDYEKAVCASLGDAGSARREARFQEICADLRGQLGDLFCPVNLIDSLSRVEAASDTGQQVVIVFRSIVTSVYYEADGLGERVRRGEGRAQELYLEFVRKLRVGWPSAPRDHLLPQLCREAWEAAIRYTAISLTDRELRMWSRLNPEGLKLTIHGKPSEIQFRPTGSEFLSMTAQHSVGGLKQGPRGAKVTYEYLLQRETSRQIPVLLSGNPGDAPVDSTIARLIAANQPICYLASEESNPEMLLHGKIDIYD
ncbi:L-tyrosine/L-tryptophan isonitrile synthase family protein [Variovorax saccharolyticus]|uniref:L-tyrosine/L-tryptophan isonitrile synthase family protein n=1 Tax=Variovorax saccharolyticus TaxID=3053516 RepID=UPI0025771633|nr:L-tyrosine/L-tryptophan isonitrile synthase family protein [Variovorax sp. J31P216]MDM0029103.1 L-tyrosine/L-tryptophan isonitrile synthase family protein [Variovorax sp. J31P216]